MPESETASSTENGDSPSLGEEGIVRLLLPTAALILGILYVNSVHGRISLSNLWYPYFVIGMLSLLSLTMYVEEILNLRTIWEEQDRPQFSNSVISRVKEWQNSIALGVFGFIYLWLIEILGFFVSSALLIIVVMVMAGERKYWKVITITAVVLVAIRLFLDFLNMTPPEGMFI